MNWRVICAVVAVALPGAFPAEPLPLDVLTAGNPLSRSIAAPATDQLKVRLIAGQFVRIVVTQAGSDLAVALSDPSGALIFQADSANGAWGPETVALIPDTTGEYVLETKPDSRAARSNWSVALEMREPTEKDRILAAAHALFTDAQRHIEKNTAADRLAAIELLRKAEAQFAAAGDDYYLALSKYTEAALAARGGDARAALSLSEGSAEIFRRIGERRGEAASVNYIGGMRDILGDPLAALEAYRNALAIFQALGDEDQLGRVLNNIGKVEYDLGDYQGALDDYKPALDAAARIADSGLEATILTNMGAAYKALGDPEQAISLFEKALPLRRAAGDKRGEARTLSSSADAWSVMKRRDEVLSALNQALLLDVAVGDRRHEAQTRKDLGRAYRGEGDFAKADQFVRDSLAIERALGDRMETAKSLLELGRTLDAAGKSREAIELCNQALNEFRAMGDRNYEGQTLESLARAQTDMGDLRTARMRMEEALRLSEETRGNADSQELRASFFATRQDAWNFYIDLLMRMRSTDQDEPLASLALEASERSRARSLIEMLSQSGAKIREGADPKLLQRENEITTQLNSKDARLLAMANRTAPQAKALADEISALENDYRDVEADIVKTSPRYAALTQPVPLKVSQIQHDLLDPGTLLLEYSLGADRSYLWAVTRDELRAFELPKRSAIEAQVNRVEELLTARSSSPRLEAPGDRTKRIAQADAALPAAARVLSDMILTPAASMLKDRTLTVVPDGALQRIPFSMLPLPASKEPLIASHEVVVLPSASALSVLRTELAGRKPSTKMIAVFADPVFEAGSANAGPQLQASRVLEHLADADTTATGPVQVATLKIPRLPWTLREADQILSLEPHAANLRATGYAASRASATNGQLSDYKYIHFATHGYLDTERPGLSALVLSQVDEQGRPLDGFLRVDDIYNLRLSADLVVLSACQTGLGKEVRGEGLMGLTRAFLYAGAPRVIVSLWNVNDLATAQLMASFYEKMLRRGKRPSEALRAAQLELRRQKRWESPYYWAAFVQQGDWK